MLYASYMLEFIFTEINPAVVGLETGSINVKLMIVFVSSTPGTISQFV